MNRTPRCLAAGLAAVTLVGAGAATAAATPAAATSRGGRFHLTAVTTAVNAANPRFVSILTGAIADHGTGTSNKGGSGHRFTVRLTRGTLTFNTARLDAITNGAHFGVLNRQTCSLYGTATAPVKIVAATGSYRGATGQASATLYLSAIVGHTSSGSCRTSGPLNAGIVTLQANGTVAWRG